MESEYALLLPQQPDVDSMIDPALMAPAMPIDPMLGVMYQNPSMTTTDVNAISTPSHPLTTESSYATTNGYGESATSIDPNLDPALMDPAMTGPVAEPATSDNRQAQHTVLSTLPKFSTEVPEATTPDIDKSYSPITAAAETASNAPTEGMRETMQLAPNQAHIDADQAEDDPQVNGIVTGVIGMKTGATSPVEHGRQSGNATVDNTSPKQEAMSFDSRRSSSHTSGTTRPAVPATDPETITAPAQAQPETTSQRQDPGRIPFENEIVVAPNKPTPLTPTIKQEPPHPNEPSTAIKPEMSEHTTSPARIKAHLSRTSTTPGGRFTRGDTAVSNGSSDPELDASERLARELQAQEHGLRRRASVRIN